MKIVLKQEKLVNMLEKLMVDNMFPSCVIMTKDKTLSSIQKEEHSRGLRFVKFKESFFDSISDDEDIIHINAVKFLDVIKRIPATTVLTVQKEGNKIVIEGEFDGRKVKPKLSYLEPEEPIKSLKEVNIEMKEGTPYVGKLEEEKIPLNIHLAIKLEDLKFMVEEASALDTEFYRFKLDNNIIKVNVGDLYASSDEVEYEPKGKIIKSGSLENIFTYGISQISKTFDGDINIKTKSAYPGWIYETGDGYILGILLPPFIDEEE